MTLSVKLNLEQKQSLAMNQSMKQLIHLLQLSNVDLSELIAREIIENPVLDESYESVDYADDRVADKVSQSLSGDDSVVDNIEDAQDDIYEDSAYYSPDRISDSSQKLAIERTVAGKETLADHLLWQARMSARSEYDYLIYERIITELDENGFLPTPIDQIGSDIKIGPDKISEISSAIQLFDPVGCCTSGVRESLLVQARHYYPDDNVLHTLISGHFTDIEKLNYDVISKKLAIPVKNIVEKSALLQNLSPYPGGHYSSGEIKYIIPDIDVKIDGDEIEAVINDDWMPSVKINKFYADLLRKKNIEKKQADFIQEKLNSAKALVYNIESRRETILKTVAAVMNHQKEFLLKGPGYLKPLTHTMIADEIGMHESTVSRVTANKYIQTSWGVFDFKSFFVSRIRSDAGSENSSDSAMHRIKEIIANENPLDPLSDEEIVEILKKEGIHAARRTVAKYRDLQNIPSSGKRKKINMIRMEKEI